MRGRLAVAIALVACLLAGQARAAETVAGNACSAGEINNIRMTGGPENSGNRETLKCNGSTWVSVGNAAAGSDKQVQLNSQGVFYASSGLTFNSTTGVLTVANRIAAGGSRFAPNSVFVTGGNATATGASATALGKSALAALTTGANNTAVGTNALAANTTAGQNTALGYNALATTTTQGANVAVGDNALAVNTGCCETAVGSGALANATSAYANTAVGSGALYTTTTAGYNTAVGLNALNGNTSGTWNSALGAAALQSNTSGNANTALAQNALVNNTTGSNNIGIGNNALQANTTASESVAIGTGSLYSTTGGQNVGIGPNAGFNLTTGANNTLLGTWVASNTLTTGSSNILIGPAVDVPSGSTSNFLNIGNTIFATNTNTGSVASPAGKVGIGTSSPISNLHLADSSVASLSMSTTNTCGRVKQQLFSSDAAATGDLGGNDSLFGWSVIVPVNQSCQGGHAGDFEIHGDSVNNGNQDVPALSIDYATQNVNIGPSTAYLLPARLNVDGTIKLTDATSVCTSSTQAGVIRFNSATNRLQSCNGTSWSDVGSGVSPLGYLGGLTLIGKASCNWVITTSWANMSANASCNTFTADGSATSPGKYPAITFASLAAGTYRITFNIAVDNSASCLFRISDGTNTAGFLHLLGQTGDYISGTFTYATAQGSKTFSLQGKSSTASSCTVYGDAATTGMTPVTDFVYRIYAERIL